MRTRDPKRIDEVLDVVRRYWQQWPDLRLTQLLLNCTHGKDAYMVEDDVLVKRLDATYGDI